MTKDLCFVDTLVSVKYNKTLKTLPLCIKYTALDESLVTNIALGLVLYLPLDSYIFYTNRRQCFK